VAKKLNGEQTSLCSLHQQARTEAAQSLTDPQAAWKEQHIPASIKVTAAGSLISCYVWRDY